MSKVEKQIKKKKSKAKLIWLIFILVWFLAVLVNVWYEYIYNPVIDFRNDIYDVTYSYCMSHNYASEMGILKEPYCDCVASKLIGNVKNRVTRDREFQKQLDLITVKCADSTKFSTVSNSVLKEQYNNTCIKGFGAHQKKYCECFSNNMVYFIRQYSYDSAIKLHLDDITKKATDSCFGHYVKADKHI